jgi:hypothetical protein
MCIWRSGPLGGTSLFRRATGAQCRLVAQTEHFVGERAAQTADDEYFAVVEGYVLTGGESAHDGAGKDSLHP